MPSIPTRGDPLPPMPMKLPWQTLANIKRVSARSSSPSLRGAVGHIEFLEQTIRNMNVLHLNAMKGMKIVWNPLEIAGLSEMSGGPPSTSSTEQGSSSGGQ